MPPGPELAAALAHIDPTALNGHDLVELAPAYLKMISHYQASASGRFAQRLAGRRVRVEPHPDVTATVEDPASS